MEKRKGTAVVKITETLRGQIRRAVERAGGAGEFARRCGIDAANISRYLSGKVNSVSDANWEKLARHLELQLPASTTGTIRNTPELREFIKDGMMRRAITTPADLTRLSGYDSVSTVTRLLAGELNWFPDLLSLIFSTLELDPAAAPITPDEKDLLMPADFLRGGGRLVRPIPVVDWANAASSLARLTASDNTLVRKWNTEETDTVPVPIGGRKDTLAFRVCGVSMEPKILDDDIILVEPAVSLDDVPDNKIVVAKFLDDGRFPENVVCKRFHRQHGHMLLTSDNPEGKIIPFSPRDLAWIGVVVRKISEL